MRTASPNETSSPKRDHLMNTAWRLFYRDGYRAVGIDMLLAEAGVAKMTLYNHFSSKEELIVAVLDQRNEAFLQSLAKAVDDAGRSPTQKILAVFDWLEAWFGTDDFRGCAFLRALSEYPESGHPIHEAALRYKNSLGARLLSLATKTGAKTPDTLAATLSLLVDGAIVAAHATGTTTPAQTARTAAASLIKSAKS